MKPEKQRLAIAELCGWKIETRQCGVVILHRITSPKGKQFTNHFTYGDGWLGYIPDYLNDLNACYEMERDGLHNTPPRSSPFSYESYLGIITQRTATEPWHATSDQRCEAFLNTHNKWEF